MSKIIKISPGEHREKNTLKRELEVLASAPIWPNDKDIIVDYFCLGTAVSLLMLFCSLAPVFMKKFDIEHLFCITFLWDGLDIAY